MFIGAAQVTLAKAPLDASSVAIQVAIKQQREFEEALRVAQERRELEQASEQARVEERRKREATQENDPVQVELESGISENGDQAEALSTARQVSGGTSLDVTA